MKKPTSTMLAILVLLLIIFIDSFSYFLIMPVLLRAIVGGHTQWLALATSENMRNILYGVAIGILPIAYFFTAPMVGHYSDVFGRKKILGICLGGAAISFLLSAIGITLKSLVLIIVGRLIGGVASASQPIAWAALADYSNLPKNLALNMALAAMMMTIAMVIGPSAGVWLSNPHWVSWFNDRTPFMVATALVVANLLLLYVGLPASSPIITVKKNTHLLFTESFQSLVKALSDQRVRLWLLLMLIYEFAWSLYFQFAPLYFTRVYHYTAEKCAYFMNWSGVWMLLGLMMIYPWLIRHFNLQRIIGVQLIIFVVTLLMVAVIPGIAVHWLSIIFMSLVVGMIYPSLLASLAQRVPPDEQGWVMGAAGSMLALSWFSSSTLMGFMADIYLSLPFSVAMVAALWAFYLHRHQAKGL